MSSTGIWFDERTGSFTQEELGEHENPERIRAINGRLEDIVQEEEFMRIDAPDRDVEPYIRLVHPQRHIEAIRNLGSISDAAHLSLGGMISTLEAIDAGEIDNGFVATRPPGHHQHLEGSEQEGPIEGLCPFNSVVIAARAAQELGYQRVAILDFDYHHGNGTQDLTYDDPDILFVSTHNMDGYPYYWRDGTLYECGRGRYGPTSRFSGGVGAVGTNVNIPVHPQFSSDEDFVTIYHEEVFPKVAAFAPDIILSSAGFDARQGDWRAGFNLTPIGFSAIAAFTELVRESWGIKHLAVLEGGYEDMQGGYTGLIDCVEAYVRGLQSGKAQPATEYFIKFDHNRALEY